MYINLPAGLITLLLLPLQSHGFVVSPTPQPTSTRLGVSAEEAAERARMAGAAALKGPPQPKLFDDDLLDDMQQCLLKLERRVKSGPGALSILEVEEFDIALHRILREMKLNEHNRPAPAPAFPDVQVDEQAAEPVQASSPARAVAAQPPVQQQQQQSAQTQTSANESEDDGPAYDGKGGFGLAKGTVNTYVIPGMDEMSPEEYQAALQKSVSDRQANRVAGGNYGNRNSSDYLNALGGSTSGKKAGLGMIKPDNIGPQD